MTSTRHCRPNRGPRAFAELLRTQSSLLASKSGGWRSADFSIGGVGLTVRANTDGALRVVTDAFVAWQETECNVPAQAPWTIDIITTNDALPVQWNWTDAVVTEDGIDLRCDPLQRTITVLCADERWALVRREGTAVAPWERAAPLRPLLDNVFGSVGLTMVHGGTLGMGGRAVLLSAAGGSGKSTCVIAGMRLGMESVGDDFVLLDAATDEPTAHSRVHALYQTARLHRSSPAWSADDVAPPDTNEQRTYDDKSLILLAERYPASLVPSQRIDAIFVPNAGHEAPDIEPMGRMEALRAVLPSSLLLADRRRESFTRITEFVRRTPTYRLRLCRDTERNADLIRAFVESSPQ